MEMEIEEEWASAPSTIPAQSEDVVAADKAVPKAAPDEDEVTPAKKTLPPAATATVQAAFTDAGAAASGASKAESKVASEEASTSEAAFTDASAAASCGASQAVSRAESKAASKEAFTSEAAFTDAVCAVPEAACGVKAVTLVAGSTVAHAAPVEAEATCVEKTAAPAAKGEAAFTNVETALADSVSAAPEVARVEEAAVPVTQVAVGVVGTAAHSASEAAPVATLVPAAPVLKATPEAPAGQFARVRVCVFVCVCVCVCASVFLLRSVLRFADLSLSLLLPSLSVSCTAQRALYQTFLSARLVQYKQTVSIFERIALRQLSTCVGFVLVHSDAEHWHFSGVFFQSQCCNVVMGYQCG